MVQTVCQNSYIALTRDERNFHDAANFRPERWLPKDHELYDVRFENDKRDGVRPFGQGPRMCPGQEIAWWESRIFVAKTLWQFNLELQDAQSIDMRRDLKAWGLWDKPKIRVRFISK